MQSSFGILKIFPSLLVNLKTFRSNSRLSNVDFKWGKKRTCSIFFSLQRFLARVAKTGASSSKVPELNRILVFHLKLLLETGKKRSHLFTFERKKPVMVASFSLGFSSFEAVSSCLELKRLKNYVLHPILFFSHFSLQRGFFSESFRLNLQLDFFSLSLEIKFVWRLKPKSDWWPWQTKLYWLAKVVYCAGAG